MKKILLALVLAGIMVLSFASCNENGDEKETDTAATDTKAEDTTSSPLFDGTYQTEDNSGWGPVFMPQ